MLKNPSTAAVSRDSGNRGGCGECLKGSTGQGELKGSGGQGLGHMDIPGQYEHTVVGRKNYVNMCIALATSM